MVSKMRYFYEYKYKNGNRIVGGHNLENNYDKVFGLQKEYTLEDYFNKKKNCESFGLFNYCPYSGEKIELKESCE